jgi:hypothetical protein
MIPPPHGPGGAQGELPAKPPTAATPPSGGGEATACCNIGLLRGALLLSGVHGWAHDPKPVGHILEDGDTGPEWCRRGRQ